MTMIQKFKCDACPRVFGARNEKGEAEAVGGVQGCFRDAEEHGALKMIDADFCPDCFDKIIKFIFNLKRDEPGTTK